VGRIQDRKCLLCGKQFISGKNTSFYSVNSSKGLIKRIKRVLGKSSQYNTESVRVCKKCYRKVDSLDKRLSVINQDQELLIGLYDRNRSDSTECSAGHFKRQINSPGIAKVEGRNNGKKLRASPQKKLSFDALPKNILDEEENDKENNENNIHCGEVISTTKVKVSFFLRCVYYLHITFKLIKSSKPKCKYVQYTRIYTNRLDS